MFKHLKLCVLLKKPHVAKDALFQYKALTQQVKLILKIALSIILVQAGISSNGYRGVPDYGRVEDRGGPEDVHREGRRN